MRPNARSTTAASCFIALVLATSTALADGAGSAEAEELFKQGRAALEAKDFATACTKLAESNRLERAVGTLISLAQCEEAQTKLAAARQHWQEAADLADALQDRLQRGPVARQRFVDLDKRVPRLTIKRAATAPQDTSVKRDEVTLGPASFGSALPVDPGPHVLVVTAAAREPRTFEITLAEGDSRELEVEPGAAVQEPTPLPVPVTGPAPADGPPAGDGTGTRLAAYSVGGAGIVALGLGAIFGLRASSKWSDAQSACTFGRCGSGSEAQTNKDAASTAGTISTVAFVVGGAALATGVVLLLIAPSPRSSPTARIRIVPGVGGAAAVGEF